MSHPRLLIVEDEAHLASGLKLNFELEGFTVTVARTAREMAESLVAAPAYDLIVLDVMLPDGDGFKLCKGLRDAGNFTPVIMLTAKGEASARIQGLNAGADDYLPKPFDLPELLARSRSILRRRGWDGQTESTTPELSFGQVRVNFDTHVVTVKGKPLKLTQLELDLIRYFADNEGRVLAREELLERVWKLHNAPNTRSVDNFILRLRKHFEPDPEAPRYFVAHRGAGYKFVRNPR